MATCTAVSLNVKYFNGVYKFQRVSHLILWHRNYSAKKKSEGTYFGYPGSPSALGEMKKKSDEFRTLLIPGHNFKLNTKRERKKLHIERMRVPRKQFMKVDQDWTDVWPTAKTFNPSVVPLPIRQGKVNGPSDNDGIPPDSVGNVELMKIPNFLHLTPAHVKKHCKALKQFCTRWPRALETEQDIKEHFPVQVANRTYISDGVSPRDFRGRLVTLKVKLSVFKLDAHGLDKMKRLLGERYDPATDTISLSADRCPTRSQNYDYLQYLMTALYFESTTIEEWELLKEPHDMEVYNWNVHASRQNVLDFIQRSAQVKDKAGENIPEIINTVAEGNVDNEEEIISHPIIQRLQEAANKLHNAGENEETLTDYKDAMKQLLLGKRVTPMRVTPDINSAAAE